MSCEQQFGGDWTIEKLDILSDYLNAYLIALKNFHFKKVYIDAFAGTGYIKSRDGTKIIEGSAKIALSLNLKFDEYYFIESNADKVSELQKMVDTEFPSLKSRVFTRIGDANEELSKICKSVNWKYNRGLLFLDPYATEVSWETLESVAGTEAIDVWYLFPIQALQRLLPNNGHMNPTWGKRIDRLLGDCEWRSELYQESQQLSFYSEPQFEKSKNTEGMKQYVIKRLCCAFPAVAPNPRIFYNTKKAPIFLFCFAVSNKSRRAQTLALKIAEYILKEK